MSAGHWAGTSGGGTRPRVTGMMPVADLQQHHAKAAGQAAQSVDSMCGPPCRTTEVNPSELRHGQQRRRVPFKIALEGRCRPPQADWTRHRCVSRPAQAECWATPAVCAEPGPQEGAHTCRYPLTARGGPAPAPRALRRRTCTRTGSSCNHGVCRRRTVAPLAHQARASAHGAMAQMPGPGRRLGGLELTAAIDHRDLLTSRPTCRPALRLCPPSEPGPRQRSAKSAAQPVLRCARDMVQQRKQVLMDAAARGATTCARRNCSSTGAPCAAALAAGEACVPCRPCRPSAAHSSSKGPGASPAGETRGGAHRTSGKASSRIR